MKGAVSSELVASEVWEIVCMIQGEVASRGVGVFGTSRWLVGSLRCLQREVQ